MYLLLIKICLLFHSFYTFKIDEDLKKEFDLRALLFLSTLNNLLASRHLKIFDSLPLHIKHFEKNIILPFLVFTTFGFLLFVFFLHFKH